MPSSTKIPTCPQGHPANQVCIHPTCSSCAFFCQDNQQCLSSHQHREHPALPTTEFQRVRADKLRISAMFYHNAIKDVTAKSEMVISEIRNLTTHFVDLITELGDQLTLLPEFQRVEDQIDNGEFGVISGREACHYVQGIKTCTHLQNRQTKLIEVHCLIDKGYKLMQSVRKKINDFLTRELLKYEIPSIQILPPPPSNGSSVEAPAQKLEKLCSKIKKDPTNPQRYFQRGLEYAKNGKNKQAEADYSTAIRLNPSFKDAYLNRGIILYNSSRHKQAQSDYNKVIELDPQNYKAYNNRGRLRHDLKVYKQAQEDYTKALSINPSFEKCLLNRGLLYQETSRAKEALEDLNLVLELAPNNSKARGNRGLLYFSLGKLKQAESDYSRALQLDPNDALFNNRGYLYFLQGELNKALDDYNRALSIKQKALYFKNRSEVYLKMGMEKQQKDDLAKAKTIQAKH